MLESSVGGLVPSSVWATLILFSDLLWTIIRSGLQIETVIIIIFVENNKDCLWPFSYCYLQSGILQYVNIIDYKV